MKLGIYLIVIVSLYVTGCSTMTQSAVEGEVIRAEIRHVVKKREGCRFSRVHYFLELTNNTGENVELNLTKLESYCKTQVDTSNLKVCVKDSCEYLAVRPNYSSINLKPNEKVVLDVVLTSRLLGTSLKSIAEFNKLFLEEDFKIWIDKICCRKSINYQVDLYLDDEEIDIQDSSGMATSLPPPQGIDTNITNLKVESSEPN